MKPSFRILKTVGKARLGQLLTAHGAIDTPSFFFCATKAALKGADLQTLHRVQTPVLLANTYHLMLQPGAQRIAAAGGLQGFMGWKGPTFTDSGGYQIFSLGHGSVHEELKGKSRPQGRLKITEEGAFFYSYRDGSPWYLSAEKSIEVQQALGADCIFTLDECTPFHVSTEYTAQAMRRSHRWAQRCLEAFNDPTAQYHRSYQGLYGISQGGIYPELRQESTEFLNQTEFFGHGIGGSLGTCKTQMYEVVEAALQGLCPGRPIHLLGIGGIEDILYGVSQGVDTFDCVAPTRLGRHGGALIRPYYWQTASEPFHPRESINLLKACFTEDDRPIDDQCLCPTCQNHSRAYLHHLFKAKESTGGTLLVTHNMFFMNQLMKEIRQAIEQENLEVLSKKWLARLA
jgi:queuine tRNA-ribosyltransferase